MTLCMYCSTSQRRENRGIYLTYLPRFIQGQNCVYVYSGWKVTGPGGVQERVDVALRDRVSAHSGDGLTFGLHDLGGLLQPYWFWDFIWTKTYPGKYLIFAQLWWRWKTHGGGAWPQQEAQLPSAKLLMWCWRMTVLVTVQHMCND